MRCNACWRELEGRAISTTCGHLLCTDDASKILSNDAACPICDQVLSKSLMKPVDINPSEEWINMSMAGISPKILMTSAYRSVMFFIGQKELEMQYKMNKIIAQCRQKCEAMHEQCKEKLTEARNAYQKIAKKCQLMEQEIESLSKDKQELQEKFAEKSRQKRKLDEMYDQLRSEFESMKRSAIQPASNFHHTRVDPGLFSISPAKMDNHGHLLQVIYMLQIDWFSLLKLQGRERTYGLQPGKGIQALDTTTSLADLPQSRHGLGWMPVTEEPVALCLELVVGTPLQH